MKEIRAVTSRTGGKTEIGLWFKSIDQLFDPEDPSPLPEKELTDLAEGTIFDHFFDTKLKENDELRLHIPQGSISPGSEDQVADAVRRHFTFRLDDLALEKRSSWREGQISTLLAIVNACAGIIVFYAYFINPSPSFAHSLIFGLFIIMNWVTIWDTYEYFLYDWRHLWRKYRIYEKISCMKVVVQQTT